MHEPAQAAEAAIELAREHGFAAAGVCSLEPSRFADHLHAWLDAGRHGSMAWLAAHAEIRADPARLLQGARAALMVADLYATRNDTPDAPLGPRDARIARYARGHDYHRVIKRRLHAISDALRDRFPNAAFRAFVDTAPVPERELAARAGVGWTGKHTLTIHPRLGSYMLLGGVMTTLDLRPPPDQPAATDHCGTCTRCIDACPTDAITPYAVDARRCISYLTIERRRPIDETLHEPIGDWLFGCDICQEVCPHNSTRRKGAGEVNPAYKPLRDRFDLLAVLGWTESNRREAFSGSALKRATLDMMKRNALIVAGNRLARTPDPDLRKRIEAIACDTAEPDLVRTAAAAVLSRKPGTP